MADYGEISAGWIEVNCRLASFTLAPEETLAYLVRSDSKEKYKASIIYTVQFD